MSLSKYLLPLLVVIAFLIRVVGIDQNPPALNWDEVSHGYNAYSILTTGKDEWGEEFPLIFRAYGDYKLPVYIYLTALSQAILGLSALSVRIPSILAGTGTVLFTYLLVKELLKNKTTALLAALLVTVEPWSFFLSRVAVEANLALFFIVAGTLYFVKGIKHYKYLYLSIMLFGLSVWTYNSARIFTPMFLLTLILIYRDKLLTNISTLRTTGYAVLLSIFFLPMFIQLINPTGQARYDNVQIIDDGAIAEIENNRNNSNYHPTVTRLVYNRPVYFLTKFASNYFSHFSPNFLFFSGGSHYQFNIPGYGLLHLVNLPFFYLAFVLLSRNIRKREYQLLAAWLLLAPLASSITREAPHTLRNIVFLPIPMIFSAFVAQKVLKNKYLLLYVGLIILSFALYLTKYSQYRIQYSHSWQYGMREVVDYIKSNYEQYDSILLTKKYGEPHEFILYYYPWNTTEYINDSNLTRFYQSNWYWVDSFNKFYFVNDWQIPGSNSLFTLESKKQVNCEVQRCLLISSPDNAPRSWVKIDEIEFLNGEKAFEIYEN